MNTLSRFYNEEIEPRLFNNVKAIFPDFYLIRGIWMSEYKLDGVNKSTSNPNRKDKTFIANTIEKGYPHLYVKEQGGDSLEFIQYVMAQKNMSWYEAVKYLAGIAEVELPLNGSYDEKKHKEKLLKQERLKKVWDEMAEALYTPQGKDILDYLKQIRRYSDEYIKEQRFGYIDTSMKCFYELRELLKYKERDGSDNKFFSFLKRVKDAAGYAGVGVGIGYTHRLAIAYFSEGEIKGFIFRDIYTDERRNELQRMLGLNSLSKYYSAYISEFDTQSFYPFALPKARFTSYDDTLSYAILVEGELDALRGIYVGIKNIVGISQGSLSLKQLERLKNKGARDIILLMDTEAKLKPDGSSNEANIKANELRVAKAVRLIKDKGLNAFVCYLPSPDGSKVDVDSFFQDLEGDALKAKAKELQHLIDEAQGGCTFLYKQLEKKYLETEKTDRNKTKFFDDTLSIINTMKSEIDVPEKETIISLFAKATGSPITLKNLEDAQNLVKPLSMDEKELQEMKAQYRTIEPLEQKDLRRSTEKIGVFLDLTFYSKDGKDKERFLLPAGALTYVCMPSSHGKTRLMENFALDIAMKEGEGEDGSVLFFTLEEDADAIEDEFLSIYYASQHIDRSSIKSKADFTRMCEECKLANNNLRTIRSYYAEADKTKKYQYFKGGGRDEALINEFEKCRKDFHSKYIRTEKLKIIYENSGSIDKIIKAIRFLYSDLQEENSSSSSPIKAIFIDHIQLLRRLGDYTSGKKEMLSIVTTELMNLSIELHLPIILAVQLNRQAYSPIELEIQNIADASEIELSGSVVMLGWNSSFKARVDSKFYYKQGKDEPQEFERRTGIKVGEFGDIYTLLGKNRAGMRDIEARFYLDKYSGLIIQGERRLEANAEQKAEDEKNNASNFFNKNGSIKKRMTEEENKNAMDAFFGSKRKKVLPAKDEDAELPFPNDTKDVGDEDDAELPF